MEDWPGLVDRSDNIIKMRSPRTSPLTKIVSTIYYPDQTLSGGCAAAPHCSEFGI